MPGPGCRTRARRHCGPIAPITEHAKECLLQLPVADRGRYAPQGTLRDDPFEGGSEGRLTVLFHLGPLLAKVGAREHRYLCDIIQEFVFLPLSSKFHTDYSGLNRHQHRALLPHVSLWRCSVRHLTRFQSLHLEFRSPKILRTRILIYH